MSKDYLQKLASDEKHMSHVALEIVADYLESHVDEIIEDNPPLTGDEESDDDLMELFQQPLQDALEKLAGAMKQQAVNMMNGCLCHWPDDERVYPAVRTLLEQLPLPRSSSFCRDDDEGYRLEVSGELVYEHLGPDEAIERTRQYVEARTFSAPPLDGKEELN